MAKRTKARAHGTGSIWPEKRTGGEVWIGQVRVDGRQYQRTLGRKRKNGAKDGLTRGMAERALRDVRDEIEKEADEDASRAKDQELLLSAVAEDHFIDLETVDGRKAWTVADYRQTLATHLLPFFGDVPLPAITTEKVNAFIRHQLKQGNSRKRGHGLNASTVANHVNILSGIYRSAIRRGLVDLNPVAAARKPRVSKADKDLAFLTIEDVEALIRAAPPTDLGRTDAAIFLTAAMTGLRRGELVALRWRDVDWVASKIRVRGSRRRGLTSDPKSETSKRAVPMASRVAGELDRQFKRSAYQGDDDLVFCNPQTGRHLDPDALSGRFRAARDRAGLPKVRFHDLRHTFGTLMAASGVDVLKIKHWMGHADIQTTLIYMHYAPTPDESAMVDRAFASRSETTPNPTQMTVTANG